MKQNSIILLFSLITIIRCQDSKNIRSTDGQSFYSGVFPVVIDTSEFEAPWAIREKRIETWFSTARYGFYYIGFRKDTLFINSSANSIPPPPPVKSDLGPSDYKIPKYKDPVEGYYLDWTEGRDFKFWEEANLNIQLDTSSLINSSYPVSITNMESDTVFIGYGAFDASLPLVLEAKDSVGTWKAIEESDVFMCGNGVKSVMLPPGHIALTLVQPYHGNYRTRFRLSLGKSYSATFEGTMNYRQFESKFDKHGHYKEEYK